MKLFMCFPEGKRKALTLSYDDGVQQDVRFLETLNKYGIKCTFNLNSRYYETDERTYKEGQIHRPMGKIAALEVYKQAIKDGHEVAVHGYTHPFWEQLPSDVMTYDILRDRERLEELFGGIIRGAAYPYGTHSDETAAVLAKCGICYCRTTVSTEKFSLPSDWLKLPATCHHINPKLPELTEKFVTGDPGKNSNHKPWLFYLWGHTYEFESGNNWEIIERFCEKIGNRDDIWYASNIAIYDYIQAYNSLRYSLRGNVIHNPTAIDVWVDREGTIYKVGAGETLTLA